MNFPSKRVVVTCGPGSEPIDEVRRITNHSTGRLGFRLSNALAEEGWSVMCVAGQGAASREPLAPAVERYGFTTNRQLLQLLENVPQRHEVAAFFHAAALCDFEVATAHNAQGELGGAAKIPSRAGEVTLVLRPAVKVISRLRALFPKARIAGWKYELEGDRQEVIQKGWAQISENQTDACILNGRAFGRDFGALQTGEEMVSLPGLDPLCAWLCEWISTEPATEAAIA